MKIDIIGSQAIEYQKKYPFLVRRIEHIAENFKYADLFKAVEGSEKDFQGFFFLFKTNKRKFFGL